MQPPRRTGSQVVNPPSLRVSLPGAGCCLLYSAGYTELAAIHWFPDAVNKTKGQGGWPLRQLFTAPGH